MTQKQVVVLVIVVLSLGAACVVTGAVGLFLFARERERAEREEAERRVRIGPLHTIDARSPTETGLIDGIVGPGKQGYTFVEVETPSAQFTWSTSPPPSTPSASRNFYIDVDGTIRFTTSPDAPTGTAGTPIGG